MPILKIETEPTNELLEATLKNAPNGKLELFKDFETL